MTPCFNQSMRPQSDEGKYLAEAEVPDLPNWIRLSSPPWGFVIILKSEFQLFSFCPNMVGLFTKPCSQFQTPCFPLARELFRIFISWPPITFASTLPIKLSLPPEMGFSKLQRGPHSFSKVLSLIKWVSLCPFLNTYPEYFVINGCHG